ncbi:hypothetical protein RFF05_12925 [Bengtsoniella intestinalis]|uniref:hypothetical protein n=1 Tax=Bengtsoniella intestinalis TaxID=3073143 RepID=UPI00391F77EE
MLNIDQILDELLAKDTYKKHFRKYKKSMVTNLFKQLRKKCGASEVDDDQLDFAMRETVRSYTSDKMSAIGVFRILEQYLVDVHGANLTVQFPVIDVSNSFERLMYLSKVLQVADKSVDDLSDELWVSTRTLEEDLARLRGTVDPIQICGIPFVVNDVTRGHGKVEFASTVHPLFLTMNITQVMTMLKGLQHMAQDPLMATYAQVSASQIWMQLSTYAKERILYVTDALMAEDASWYRSLQWEADTRFQTESQCSCTVGCGVLMNCLKNGKSCFVEYQCDGGGVVFYENCFVSFVNGGTREVELRCDSGTITIASAQVLRSAYSKEELI